MPARRVLISLHDTTNVEVIAAELVALGFEIVATAETCALLAPRGIPVTSIDAFTGNTAPYPFPATLHPSIEKALTTDDAATRIDMVYVIPYPMSVGNDIGGRTLLALACKGRRVPLFQRADMEAAIAALKQRNELDALPLADLMDKTHRHIAAHFSAMSADRSGFQVVADLARPLENGENPYQVPAALYRAGNDDDLSLGAFQVLSGNPCYTNIADSDNLLQTLCLLAQACQRNYSRVPHICLAAKHGNPCGAAISWDSPVAAVTAALFGNPNSIWGGELIANFLIDEEVAGALFSSTRREELCGDRHWMLDVVLAPEFSPAATTILTTNKRRKLLANRQLYQPQLSDAAHFRKVRGGLMVQPPNNYVLDFNEIGIAAEKRTAAETDSLLIAWAVAWNSFHGGNEVAIAKDGKLLAAGGGPSTVEATRTAIRRGMEAGHALAGSAYAANAFFPFTDAVTLFAQAGCSFGAAPSGAMRDDDVQRFCTEAGMPLYWLAPPHRGFSRH